MPLTSSIDGVSGPENIGAWWKDHYSDIFNCVKSDEFNLGIIPSNDGVFINSKEVKDGIKKL